MGPSTSPVESPESPAVAKQTWERINNITSSLEPNSQNDSSWQISQQPWKNDPLYFKSVKVSELALLRMLIHTSSAPSVESVGLLRGKIDGDAFVVLDSFALPIQPTETGLYDAQTKLHEYYHTQMQAGGLENVLGWYRSHPTYGQIVSSPDVSTQIRIQQFKEPSFALLIEPSSIVSLGKLMIEGFRTYPEGYTSPNSWGSELLSDIAPEVLEQASFLEKRHPLKVTFFKTSVDGDVDHVWNKYWTRNTSPSASGCICADKEVSVEDKGAPPLYSVSVDLGVAIQYRTCHEILEALFVKLMEEVGSSRGQIMSSMRSSFCAKLTEEQAEKLSGKDGVKRVRPDSELKSRDCKYCFPDRAFGTYDRVFRTYARSYLV